MKSVNPFFAPAAKKCKYICEEETRQISEKAQPSMKRNNENEEQRASTEGLTGLCWRKVCSYFIFQICHEGDQGDEVQHYCTTNLRGKT